MLPRWLNVIILAFWVYAAWELFSQDILPDLVVGPPPDFRTISQAETEGESRWSIVIEDQDDRSQDQAVGQVMTRSVPEPDGGWRLLSKAWFDSGAVLKKTPFASVQSERFEIEGQVRIDPRGNLSRFRVDLHAAQAPDVDLLMIEGRLQGEEIHVQTRGLIPYLGPRTFAYEPHSVVQTSFSPLDRLPGLRVGQSWEQQVINPITREAMKCRCEVVDRQTIMYDGNPTSTLVVLTKTGGPSPPARTWVRTDGLVVRQEVPLMIRKLVLQRLPPDPQDVPFPVENDSFGPDPKEGASASPPSPFRPADGPARSQPGDRR